MDLETTAPESGESFVVIGRVARAQGRHGEIAIQPATEPASRFLELARVFLDGVESREYDVESVRFHKGRPVLTLAGVSSIGEAKALAGREVRIREEDLGTLPEDVYYHFQLIGATIVDRKVGAIGRVEDVLTTGGTDLLVVRAEETPGSGSNREVLVPLCQDICLGIDPVRKRIDARIPEGLLELNAD